MKRIFFAAFAGLICFFTSCDSKTETTSENRENAPEQKNMAAFNIISKAFETGDNSGIGSVVSDDFVDHTERGEVKGKDSLKAMIAMMHNTMKDMKTETVNSAANGDYVYGWMRYKGTSDGSMEMPKGPYDMTTVGLAKLGIAKLLNIGVLCKWQT